MPGSIAAAHAVEGHPGRQRVFTAPKAGLHSGDGATRGIVAAAAVFPAPKAGLHSGLDGVTVEAARWTVFPAPKAGLHSGDLRPVRRWRVTWSSSRPRRPGSIAARRHGRRPDGAVVGLPGPEGRAP